MAHSARRGTTSRYSFKKHGRSSRKQGRLGDYVLKPNNGTEAWSPSWNHTTTVFRPFPVPSAEDPNQLCGFKLSEEPDDFDDWIRGYPAVRNWGDPGITFLLFDPTDDINPEDHPAWVLYRCVDGRVQAGQAPAHWQALLQGGQGRSAMLKAPQDLYLMQGALLEQRSKPYNPPRGGAPEDDLVVLQVTQSAIQEMAPLINEMDGDLVSLEAGQGGLLQIFQLGGAADPSHAGSSGFGESRESSYGRSKDRKIGYGVSVIQEWNGVSGDLSAVAEMVSQKVKPWEEVVQILPIEEQAHLLAKHFPADVIWEAFADHRYEGWIPEHVERAVNQSVSVASPGTPPATTEQVATEAPASPFAAPAPVSAAPESGWGAARAAEAPADPLARPTGPVVTETDPTVPAGLPVDDIASAMAAASTPKTRDDIIAEARKAISDE
jgi:hypothetical protein